MAYDLDEQEKLDALRAWWDRYGTLVAVAVFVIVAAIVGWRGWQWYQTHQANQAMGYFEALQTAAGQEGEDAISRIQAATSTLRESFPDSGYTSRGVLVAASALAERGQLDAARDQLQWLAQRGKEPAMAALARLRLAGVLMEQQQYDQALAQLANAPASFEALYADRRGDILLAQGKIAEARAEWQRAKEAFGSDPIAQIVQLKIDAIAGA
ncbi:MAG TPA: tetratricopeptide repeat protein [Burkholderiaceae bacterium]|jgi:predicted negative regulator of RcsB-dependent stress response|nr:tetratricopeptide repeat protein [Burkholderiaceae bacterium]